MKKITFLATGLLISASTFAQPWVVDKAHATLGFTITHMMVSDVDGKFKNFDATITSKKADFSDAEFNIAAQTNSIFTDNDKRDTHLKSPDFFDAAKNPTVTFHSTSVQPAGDHKLKITGQLTMHGVTRTVVLDGSFKGPLTHPMTKKPDVGFKVTGKVKRSDFGIGGSMPEAIISDEVVITANGEFQQG